jgi:hypothetical protein
VDEKCDAGQSWRSEHRKAAGKAALALSLICRIGGSILLLFVSAPA